MTKAPPGRYTAPIPKDRRKSPAWFGVVLLALLILGLLVIVLNYVKLLPGGVSNFYLIAGIGAIVVGLGMATFYR
ncbi:MAG: cell division protein CrgA [Acidimicrobiales bacterium]